MSLTLDQFTDFLLTDALDTGSTAFIDKLLKAAREAILAGNGTLGDLTSSGLNGKSFTKQITLSSAEVAAACRTALRRYAGDGDDADEVRSTNPDFSALIR